MCGFIHPGRSERLTDACCDTLQVTDYCENNMAGFNEQHKREMRAKRFPQDLEKAFRMGVRLNGGK